MEPRRKMLRAKIHRAVVTDANLDYEGSLTVPPDLLRAADIMEYEAVNVWNITRGTRFETYAIAGVKGSGQICVNGAAAHLAGPGEKIIIAAFADVPESTAGKFRPTIVFVDERNAPVRTGPEIAGPANRRNGC